MRRAELECAGTAANVSVARRFVRTTLRDWGAQSYEWTAEALVSELATNAVIHARTDFLVVLMLSDDALVLDVADGSPLVPKLRRFESTATTGRGIRMVEALATSWSATVTNGRKVVSCVIARADSAGRLQSPGENVLDIVALLDRFAAEDDTFGTPRDVVGAA